MDIFISNIDGILLIKKYHYMNSVNNRQIILNNYLINITFSSIKIFCYCIKLYALFVYISKNI